MSYLLHPHHLVLWQNFWWPQCPVYHRNTKASLFIAFSTDTNPSLPPIHPNSALHKSSQAALKPPLSLSIFHGTTLYTAHYTAPLATILPRCAHYRLPQCTHYTETASCDSRNEAPQHNVRQQSSKHPNKKILPCLTSLLLLWRWRKLLKHWRTLTIAGTYTFMWLKVYTMCYFMIRSS